MKIANAHLWVHDQDAALAFYTEKLGMEVRSDVTLPEMGDFRWLTVSPAGQEDVSIVLMAIPGEPMIDARNEEADRRTDGEGLRRHGLPHHRRLPRRLREAARARRRVHRSAGRAPLRDRRRLPRPLRQQHPPDRGQGPAERLARRDFAPKPAARAGFRVAAVPERRDRAGIDRRWALLGSNQ